MGTDEVQLSSGCTFGLSLCSYAEEEIDICVFGMVRKYAHLHLILAQIKISS